MTRTTATNTVKHAGSPDSLSENRLDQEAIDSSDVVALRIEPQVQGELRAVLEKLRDQCDGSTIRIGKADYTFNRATSNFAGLVEWSSAAAPHLTSLVQQALVDALRPLALEDGAATSGAPLDAVICHMSTSLKRVYNRDRVTAVLRFLEDLTSLHKRFGPEQYREILSATFSDRQFSVLFSDRFQERALFALEHPKLQAFTPMDRIRLLLATAGTRSVSWDAPCESAFELAEMFGPALGLEAVEQWTESVGAVIPVTRLKDILPWAVQIHKANTHLSAHEQLVRVKKLAERLSEEPELSRNRGGTRANGWQTLIIQHAQKCFKSGTVPEQIAPAPIEVRKRRERDALPPEMDLALTPLNVALVLIKRTHSHSGERFQAVEADYLKFAAKFRSEPAIVEGIAKAIRPLSEHHSVAFSKHVGTALVQFLYNLERYERRPGILKQFLENIEQLYKEMPAPSAAEIFLTGVGSVRFTRTFGDDLLQNIHEALHHPAAQMFPPHKRIMIYGIAAGISDTLPMPKRYEVGLDLCRSIERQGIDLLNVWISEICARVPPSKRADVLRWAAEIHRRIGSLQDPEDQVRAIQTLRNCYLESTSRQPLSVALRRRDWEQRLQESARKVFPSHAIPENIPPRSDAITAREDQPVLSKFDEWSKEVLGSFYSEGDKDTSVFKTGIARLRSKLEALTGGSEIGEAVARDFMPVLDIWLVKSRHELAGKYGPPSFDGLLTYLDHRESFADINALAQAQVQRGDYALAAALAYASVYKGWATGAPPGHFLREVSEVLDPRPDITLEPWERFEVYSEVAQFGSDARRAYHATLELCSHLSPDEALECALKWINVAQKAAAEAQIDTLTAAAALHSSRRLSFTDVLSIEKAVQAQSSKGPLKFDDLTRIVQRTTGASSYFVPRPIYIRQEVHPQGNIDRLVEEIEQSANARMLAPYSQVITSIAAAGRMYSNDAAVIESVTRLLRGFAASQALSNLSTAARDGLRNLKDCVDDPRNGPLVLREIGQALEHISGDDLLLSVAMTFASEGWKTRWMQFPVAAGALLTTAAHEQGLTAAERLRRITVMGHCTNFVSADVRNESIETLFKHALPLAQSSDASYAKKIVIWAELAGYKYRTPETLADLFAWARGLHGALEESGMREQEQLAVLDWLHRQLAGTHSLDLAALQKRVAKFIRDPYLVEVPISGASRRPESELRSRESRRTDLYRRLFSELEVPLEAAFFAMIALRGGDESRIRSREFHSFRDLVQRAAQSTGKRTPTSAKPAPVATFCEFIATHVDNGDPARLKALGINRCAELMKQLCYRHYDGDYSMMLKEVEQYRASVQPDSASYAIARTILEEVIPRLTRRFQRVESYTVPDSIAFVPWAHQKEAAVCALFEDRPILIMDAGTGKTETGVMIAESLNEKGVLWTTLSSVRDDTVRRLREEMFHNGVIRDYNVVGIFKE